MRRPSPTAVLLMSCLAVGFFLAACTSSKRAPVVSKCPSNKTLKEGKCVEGEKGLPASDNTSKTEDNNPVSEEQVDQKPSTSAETDKTGVDNPEATVGATDTTNTSTNTGSTDSSVVGDPDTSPSTSSDSTVSDPISSSSRSSSNSYDSGNYPDTSSSSRYNNSSYNSSDYDTNRYSGYDSGSRRGLSSSYSDSYNNDYGSSNYNSNSSYNNNSNYNNGDCGYQSQQSWDTCSQRSNQYNSDRSNDPYSDEIGTIDVKLGRLEEDNKDSPIVVQIRFARSDGITDVKYNYRGISQAEVMKVLVDPTKKDFDALGISVMVGFSKNGKKCTIDNITLKSEYFGSITPLAVTPDCT